MKTRNPNTYRARFSKLRIHAFGKQQTLAGEFDLEIYQARISPELWLARPASPLVEKEWRAGSAEQLMEHVATYFEECIQTWQLCAPGPEAT